MNVSHLRPLALKGVLVIAVLASLLAAIFSLARVPAAHAASASTGALSGTTVTVNNGPGNQTDPHVSSDWVSYTDDSTGISIVRYHNLTTGQDAAVPESGSQDLLSGISGTTVVYMHATSSSQDIYRYDIGSGNAPVALAPQQNVNVIRELPAIGNRTVAWEDYTADPAHPQIVAYNLDTQTATPITNDTTLLNFEPAVSPDGSLIVWARCTGNRTGCNIWQATSSEGTWSVSQLTSGNNSELPHTDGKVVVYDSTRTTNGTTTQGIYWQPVGGGQEQEVPFPTGTTTSRNPHVSGTLISFENYDTTASYPNWNIWVYSLATQTLYQVTSSLNDETLSDVSVTSDGTARVVWQVFESDYNVYGFVFQAPTADAPLTITKLVVGANEQRQAGLAAIFTDADPAGTFSQYSATITWGDGASSAGLIAKNPIGAGFVVGGAHQYAKAGTYTVTLTIHDSGGSNVTGTHTLVVP